MFEQGHRSLADPKIISVTNRKGGVGKSTVSTHIAAGLATRGYNIAIVDTDSQGHAGLMLNMPEENGLYAALVDERPIEEVVRLVPPEHYSTADMPSQGNLYLLPSGDKTYKIPRELEDNDTMQFLAVLEDFIKKMKLHAVIVDTNPTMTLFDGSVYLASDAVLYVTECERLSFDGVAKAMQQLQRFQKRRLQYMNRQSYVLGILPNKLRANTKLHRHNISKLSEAFPGLVWTPITQRNAWAAATNYSELIYTYAPGGAEATDAWTLVDRTEKALEQWQATEEG